LQDTITLRQNHITSNLGLHSQSSFRHLLQQGSGSSNTTGLQLLQLTGMQALNCCAVRHAILMHTRGQSVSMSTKRHVAWLLIKQSRWAFGGGSAQLDRAIQLLLWAATLQM
jgi:hypothetical protein